MSRTQQMNMAPITAQSFKLYIVAFFKAMHHLPKDPHNLFIQQCLLIFHRKAYVVVNLSGPVISFLNFPFPHPHILEYCFPAARLQGISS